MCFKVYNPELKTIDSRYKQTDMNFKPSLAVWAEKLFESETEYRYPLNIFTENFIL